MAEVRGEEWLPEGWKVEVRVRKTGRKDRYYTDPVSGHVFRSLRDIDRYLLTGKLGRHVVKNPKTNTETPVNTLSNASMEKNSTPANGPKKLPVGVQKKNPARCAPNKPVSGSKESNEKSKNRKITKPPHSKASKHCFILNPDPGAKATSEHDLPNLSEIIESVRKSEDSGNSTYLSAQEIAALLVRQTPHGDAANQNGQAPLVASNSAAAADTALDQRRDSDAPLAFSYTDICSDPCIEFAIKTLTGAIPLDGAPSGLKDPMVGDLL